MSDERGFFDVARTQRAHRAFTTEAVTDEVVMRVLEAATWAPSAENRQPWEFVVVRDELLRQQLGEIFRAAWEGGGRDFSVPRLDEKLFTDTDKGMTGGVAAAPVLVVVCSDTERGLTSTVPSSIFPAVQNLLLAANAVGLGSALTTLATGRADELRKLLDLPEHVVPVAVVPLGWPARKLGLSKRNPVSTHMHRDRYGAAW